MSQCVLAPGVDNGRGYVVVYHEGRSCLAHRVAWMQRNGAIPEGMHIHHECRTRRCVNIDHLTLVSPAEHVRLHLEERETCRQGHALTDDNLVPGTRQCRKCLRDRSRRSDARRRRETAAFGYRVKEAERRQVA